MRSEIIVTVKDTKGKISSYDVEVPVKITAERAARDIVEAVNYYKDRYGKTKVLPGSRYRLKNERTSSVLDPQKTLYECGVWQGDVLTIIES